MDKKWIYTSLIGALVIVNLTGCNLDNNNNNIEPADVNYNPVRNTPANDLNDNNLNRGTDIDLDPRDVREPREIDTPYNMDEDEPDLDEEPSEERRGF
jgi:hypothetical protein